MINVVMPKAGLTMERGTVSKWLKAEGTKVEKREYILEIENEKTVIEVESPGDGILHITAEVGEEYEVAGVLGYLAADEAEYKKLLAEGVDQKNTSEAVQEQAPEKTSENATVEKAVHEMKNAIAAVKSSPIAKKLAKQAGIDLSSITGTGPNGRIVEDDVKKFIEATKQSFAETATQTVVEEIRRVPLTLIRRAISRSKSNSNIYSQSVTPILNRDQTCLLGTGAIIKEPVVINDELQIRPLIALDFTFDHRVLDGAAANAFLATIAQHMADPEAILF